MEKNRYKILLSFPGHLKTVPMNRYVYETFIKLGHDVASFDFGSKTIVDRMIKKLSKEQYYKHINNKLLKKIKKIKPDIFITIFGFDHDKETIRKIHDMGIKTACWWLNDPFQFERSLNQASFYDYYFTNSEGSVREYQEAGISQAYYLPVGCFEGVHKKDDTVEKIYDISFAGDHGPVREKVILELIKDFNISIFGPWKNISKDSPINKYIVSRKFFTPEEMSTIFNQSKIVLNIHSWFEKSDVGINPRIFEANGCGAFQISDDKEEIKELYSIDEEIVVYKTIDELKKKLQQYLADDKARETIANSGYKRSLKDHTYDIRMNKMLSIIMNS